MKIIEITKNSSCSSWETCSSQRNNEPVEAQDPALIDNRAPRYTSYPTADRFVEAFTPADTKRYLGGRDIAHNGPLSLYIHIPFCESLCYYCACNKKVTKEHEKGLPYVHNLLKEMRLIAASLKGDKRVSQMHWGGGTPTFLNTIEIRTLLDGLKEILDFSSNGEYSIEIDPRTVQANTLSDLAELGFNRLSLGVQDFSPDVQRAINRVQPVAQVQAVLDEARSLGFKSTNFDLIYGLPKQTVETYNQTLDTVLDMRPERIALYHYAHLPSRFKSQRLIPDSDLANSTIKQEIFELANERLDSAGYDYIGMDHFALPDDELAVANRSGRLHRNFQGYSTQPDCDVIGLGASAISRIGTCYSQNARNLKEYKNRIEHNSLATIRGIELSRDDVIRRAIIMAIMCQGVVDKGSIEIAHLVDFDQYFNTELQMLQRFVADNLVSLSANRIVVTPLGRRKALRSIGSVFDSHLQRSQQRNTYSKVL
ncbi:UNVERIFIED_CONTAM: hypothetical protein GTU68_042015 [Idotea baltica]|nr:hypothetical protein [Idotea baltica]